MVDRRTFLKGASAMSAALSMAYAGSSLAKERGHTMWFMPDESERHTRTWMAFGASKHIWGRQLFPVVQQELATIALTIAEYEPVSMLVRERDMPVAKALMGEKVTLIPCPLDDLWIRDTGPVFVLSEQGAKRAINFNFNGWGNKQAHSNDALVADFVANLAGVPVTRSDLVLEGGGIEVDGHGTAIITESCVLNDNRNPGLSKAECEEALKALLGLDKIIWLPGIKGKDITDGHTDFYARFAGPAKVVAAYDPDPYSFDHQVTKTHLEILKKQTDAQGRTLEISVLEAPSTIRPKFANDEFAAGYVNFYVCNGAVLVPEFGDVRADNDAKETLQKLFPNRDIVQLNIDAIAAGGGGIHCATQQEPALIS